MLVGMEALARRSWKQAMHAPQQNHAALLVLGLFTRPVAFLLSGEMAVAYFQFHAPRGFWPVLNGGVSAALYCFVWLYFSGAGAGPWSVVPPVSAAWRNPRESVE